MWWSSRPSGSTGRMSCTSSAGRGRLASNDRRTKVATGSRRNARSSSNSTGPSSCPSSGPSRNAGRLNGRDRRRSAPSRSRGAKLHGVPAINVPASRHASSKGCRGCSISSLIRTSGWSPSGWSATTASKSSAAGTTCGTGWLDRTSRPSRTTRRWSRAASTASSIHWRASDLGSGSPGCAAAAMRSDASGAVDPRASWSSPRMHTTRNGTHRSEARDVTVTPPLKKSGRPGAASSRPSRSRRTSSSPNGTAPPRSDPAALSTTSRNIRSSASNCHSA